MKIESRGPCREYWMAHTPMKPWGVLLHTTEGGSKAYLDGLFTTNRRDDGVVVSVQFAVFADGAIHSYCPWEPGKAWCCWHAGKSSLGDHTGTVSDILLGIEIQHRAGETYPQAQIDALVWLLKQIQSAYRGQPYWQNILTEHRLVSPGRKSDPTTPWDSVKAAVYAAWNQQEDDMAIDKVSEQTAAPEIARLKAAGLLNSDHDIDEAASVGLVLTMMGRLLAKLEASPK